MNLEKIGNFIAECRKEKNLTQEQLAEKLGITYKAVSKWECGKGLPDVSTFKELCNILNISLDELFEGRKLNRDEISKVSEKNIISLLITRTKLENFQILIEILIVVAIITTITLTPILADNDIQRILIIGCGSFVWLFGLFLRVKIRKIINNLDKKD